jgi:hypothetical protein
VKYGRLRWPDCITGHKTVVGGDHFKDKKKAEGSITTVTRGMCFGHGGADWRWASVVIFVDDCTDVLGVIEILLVLMK